MHVWMRDVLTGMIIIGKKWLQFPAVPTLRPLLPAVANASPTTTMTAAFAVSNANLSNIIYLLIFRAIPLRAWTMDEQRMQLHRSLRHGWNGKKLHKWVSWIVFLTIHFFEIFFFLLKKRFSNTKKQKSVLVQTNARWINISTEKVVYAISTTT